jgi:protein phosphatase-4 regulatory subunit 3
MVALKDDAYLKQLIKSGLYGAVVHALVANGPKYNMLNSAVIDLFDYIRKVAVELSGIGLASNRDSHLLAGVQENLKATIKHVVEVHGELLREIDYVTTFKEFCLRYEQNEDSSMLEPLPYVTLRVPYVH